MADHNMPSVPAEPVARLRMPPPPRPEASSHATTVRGLAAGATPGLPFGRFGPMFDLPPCPSLPPEGLAALAAAMVKQDDGAPIIEREPVDENDRIPAGYTYFGQFVDHDLTLDTTPLGAKLADRDALVDFRSPALDLDSVYGRGPGDQPYLYERDGLRLRLGDQVNPEPLSPVNTRLDIQRLRDGSAILGDKRNDENKIVSQLHGAFIALHNKVVMDDALLDAFGADRSTTEARFAAAATIVRWHYQWVVVHDFLQRVCEPGMVEEVLNPGGTPRLQHYLKQEAAYPYMPLEFSGAAYRFGHSMVRPSYSLNRVVLTRQGGKPDKERIPTFSRETGSRENLNGFPGTLPEAWGIDWSFFLDDVEGVPGGVKVGEEDAKLPQPSYRIDALLAEPLKDLPEFFDPAVPPGSKPSIVGNLAFRNLKRGQMLRLPSGQAVARALGITPLPDDVLWGAGSRIPLPPGSDPVFGKALADTAGLRGDFRKDWVDAPGAPLKGNTPLWYYILREAEFFGATEPSREGASMGGQHLGPVGSRIVAETLIALLWLDPSSYLHSSRGFQPLPAISGGRPLTLGRLVSFALR